MRIFISIALLLCVSCAPKKSDEKMSRDPIVNPDGSKTIRSYYANNKVKSEVTYRDSIKHGLAKSYDEEGNLMLEVNYVNGKREGIAKRYYTGGILYQSTEYKDDVMHGKQLKFRANGNQISEARFENEYPCLGLREWLDNKQERTKFPQIVIKTIDKVAVSGDFILEITMDPPTKRVKYYSGKLTPSGCLSLDAFGLPMDEQKTKGVMKYHIFPGEFVMEEINIIAVAETLNGNSYVSQKKYNLAIKN